MKQQLCHIHKELFKRLEQLIEQHENIWEIAQKMDHLIAITGYYDFYLLESEEDYSTIVYDFAEELYQYAKQRGLQTILFGWDGIREFSTYNLSPEEKSINEAMYLSITLAICLSRAE